MAIELTIFGSDSKGKVPVSPYSDNTFDFCTNSFKTLREAYKEMSENFTMSKPLNLDRTRRLLRRKNDVLAYKREQIKILAIDIDEITDESSYKKVLDYFSKKDYPVILGKSRRWNGSDIFNIKGIMKVDLKNEPRHIKNALSILQTDLGKSVKIDMSVGDTVSYQAPTTKNFVIYVNEDGKYLLDDNKATLVAANNKTNAISTSTSALLKNVKFTQDITNTSLEVFRSLGFVMLDKFNDNGSINFRHGNEVNSPGGYFWWNNSPFMMHHNNKDRSVNIFGYIISPI